MSNHTAALHETEKIMENMPAQLANVVPQTVEPVTSSGQTTAAPTLNDNDIEKRSTKGSIAGAATGDKDVEAAAAGAGNGSQQQDTSRLLTGKKLALVFAGMLLSVFLIALDQTILAPALPVIASKFNSLESIAWIASAYFLTQTALLPLYGQALTVFDRKWCYMVAIALFELGSLVCAVPQSVEVLIFGRALAGCGAAGIFVAVLSIIADVTTLEQRPALLGLFGGVFAISSVVGPLLGGVFTDHVSWRWCFYINLPIGALTIAVIILVLGPQPAGKMSAEVESFTRAKVTRWTRGKWNPSVDSYLFRLASLDWMGSIIMLGLITCLVLALQWGGITYPWSDGRVVGTLVATFVLIGCFILYEWKLAGPAQLLPFKYFKDKTQVGASLYVFCVMLLFLVFLYYLPSAADCFDLYGTRTDQIPTVYYEATRGVSASRAGINILPFMIGSTLAAGVAGGIVSKTGRYWYIIVLAPCLSAIGAGLLFTVKADTSNGKLIGFQILYGVGLGMILQQPIIVVQATAKSPADIPQKTAIVTFSQLIGGTVGIAIANSIFFDKLGSAMTKYAPDADIIVRTSVEAIKDQPEALQPGIKIAYAEALKYVFIMGVPCAGAASIIAILLIKNISIKGNAAVGGASH